MMLTFCKSFLICFWMGQDKWVSFKHVSSNMQFGFIFNLACRIKCDQHDTWIFDLLLIYFFYTTIILHDAL